MDCQSGYGPRPTQLSNKVDGGLSAARTAMLPIAADFPHRADGGTLLPVALTELKHCVGTQFDAECVRAFLEAIECGNAALLPRYDAPA